MTAVCYYGNKSPLYHYYVPVDGGEVLTVRRQVLR